jgi:hypothetical protein
LGIEIDRQNPVAVSVGSKSRLHRQRGFPTPPFILMKVTVTAILRLRFWTA